MKKSRFVFLLLFLSLFFNVMHDLVLHNKLNHLHVLDTVLDDDVEHQKEDTHWSNIHEKFHFMAIFHEFIALKSTYAVYEKPIFSPLMPKRLLSKNSFRPPIA